MPRMTYPVDGILLLRPVDKCLRWRADLACGKDGVVRRRVRRLVGDADALVLGRSVHPTSILSGPWLSLAIGSAHLEGNVQAVLSRTIVNDFVITARGERLECVNGWRDGQSGEGRVISIVVG